MSIASISSSLVNLYSAQGASASTPARNATPAADADHGAHRNERATGRRSVLVDAMLTALKELGLGSLPGADAPATTPTDATPATPPAAADTATPAIASTDDAAATASTTSTTSTASGDDSANFGDVTQAVAHFAHALWSAVRDTDAAKAGEVGVDNDTRTGTGRRHHHRHAHGAEHGYDNLAERLAALASVTDPAAASLKTATEVAQHAVANATAAQPDPTAAAADPTAATDAATATTTTTAGADASSVVVAADPTAAATAPTAVPSPLADAFGQLLTALRGGSAPSDSESAALLSRFLQTLAAALQPSQVASAAPVATGALIDVTA
jgi:hypothetical protein